MRCNVKLLVIVIALFASTASFAQAPPRYFYELYQTKDDSWTWKFIDSKGTIIAIAGTTFKTQEEATNAAALMRKFATAPIVIDSKQQELSELEKRLNKLSPEERAILLQRLQPKK